MKVFHLLLSVILLAFAQGSKAGEVQADLQAALPAFRVDEQRIRAIEKFASLAKAGDSEAMLLMIVPAARAAEGDDEMRRWLTKEVVPVFAAYDHLHTYRSIEPRRMPDNSVGYRYYTYFISTSGSEVPFDIIVMEIDGKTLVANFNSRGCIKGKHPVCK